MSTSDTFLTSRELCELLRVSAATLHRWRSLPDLNGLPYVLVGGQIRYARAAVDAWIASRSQIPQQAE